MIIYLAFFIAYAIKSPFLLQNSWWPDAHWVHHEVQGNQADLADGHHFFSDVHHFSCKFRGEQRFSTPHQVRSLFMLLTRTCFMLLQKLEQEKLEKAARKVWPYEAF